MIPACDRTKEGYTRKECVKFGLSGAVIERHGCESCADNIKGSMCGFGDYYGDSVLKDGQCVGWHRKGEES